MGMPDHKSIALYAVILVLAISVGAFAPKGFGIDSSPDTPVVLITLESVRSHNIGPCYGYERETAPNICSLAEDGVLFKNAYSHGTATTNSIPSLITGEIPVAVARNNISQPLLPNARSLTTILEERGYNSSGYFDTVQNKMIFSDMVLQLNERNPWQEYNRSKIAERVDDKTFTWVFARSTTHKPYYPDQEYRRWDTLTEKEMRERRVIGSYKQLNQSFMTLPDLVDLYDEAILTEDARVGQLIQEMKQEGVYNESLIIVTGDHGDSFGRHNNIGHGDSPVEEQIRVPLIIKLPGNKNAGTTVENVVRHVDVVPTIADYLDIRMERKVFGKSLRPLINGETDERMAISSTFPLNVYSYANSSFKLHFQNPRIACINGGPEKTALYLLKNGHSPRVDVSPVNKEISSQFESELCQIYSEGYRRRLANLATD